MDKLFLRPLSFHARTPRRFQLTVSKPKAQKPLSFETALAEIEGIVASMEAGQLPLEQSLAAYKRGAELLQFCQAQIAQAQQQVKILEAGTLQNFKGGDGTD
ncbi:MAG: exodeoxyribonuclease VII small subunit [Burkholderiales bacterium]